MDLIREIAQDELVNRCRKGDEKAFNEVYNRFAGPMLNSSMRLLNNLPDAEDMVQEAFADAFSRLDTFVYKSSFQAWLLRITLNKSLNLLRERRKLQWTDVEMTDISDAEDAENESSARQYTPGDVKNAIQLLPENYRVVFNLYAVDNIPHEEIARMLNISHNNVRIIYHRAKKKIKEILQNGLK